MPVQVGPAAVGRPSACGHTDSGDYWCEKDQCSSKKKSQQLLSEVTQHCDLAHNHTVQDVVRTPSCIKGLSENLSKENQSQLPYPEAKICSIPNKIPLKIDSNTKNISDVDTTKELWRQEEFHVFFFVCIIGYSCSTWFSVLFCLTLFFSFFVSSFFFLYLSFLPFFLFSSLLSPFPHRCFNFIFSCE